MAIVTSIVGLVSSAIKPMAKLIDDFHFSDQEKAELQKELAVLEADKLRQAFDLELVQIELQRDVEKANASVEIAALKTAAMGANSGDRFTSRARPAIIYIGLLVMVVDVLGNAIGSIWDKSFTINMPDKFWYAWSVVSGGYVMLRSLVDKKRK